jgi:signal transduction histidine kinase/ActR/RegA family two-component response regulator
VTPGPDGVPPTRFQPSALSTRARVVIAAAVATLPLVGLVAFAAVDRYNADHARAVTRASTRADLYAALIGEVHGARPPSPARLRHLLALTPPVEGSVVTILDRDGRRLSSAGATAAGLPRSNEFRAVLTAGAGTITGDGADGVGRIWGVRAVPGTGWTVLFGLPGSSVYGPAATALKRDLAIAAAAAILALGAAFLLAGRLTAPIRRLAAAVGSDRGGGDIRAIERGFAELGEVVAESETELKLRADRLSALNAIDTAILNAATPEDIAAAAAAQLRQNLGSLRTSVVLFDFETETARSIAIAAAESPRFETGRVFPIDSELSPIETLRAGSMWMHQDLASIEGQRSEIVSLLVEEGVRAYASVPLRLGSELVGSVNVGFAEPGIASEGRLAIAREVSGQLAIALQHARLHAELEAIVDSALDAIVVLGSDRRIVSANRTAGQVLGVAGEDLVGRRGDELLPAVFSEDIWSGFRAAQSIERVFTVALGDGVRQLDVRGRADFLPGRHLLVIRDVTERITLEERLRQSQKMEAIGNLAGGVAHDFNNVLMAIRTCGALLLRGLEDEQLRQYVVEIDNAAERAVKLTHQLLAFSRRQVLRPEVTDLNSVVGDTLTLLQRLIPEDIEIRCELEPDLRAVLIDRGQLSQVLLNLAVNARDAMQGGGALTIRTANVVLDQAYASDRGGVAAGAYSLLQISDSGDGMDEETRSRAFDPFFTTKEQGTGLGLATVYGIVKQSGGEIWLYSEPGLGTTVKIYFPSEAAMVAPAADSREVSTLEGDETVLLVEDEVAVRRLVGTALRSYGYTVVEAANGREALALAAEHDAIDVLLTDVVMPGMNGRELADRLTASRPGLKVLFTSGYPADMVLRHGIAKSDIAYVEKPYLPDDLAHKLRELLAPVTTGR